MRAPTWGHPVGWTPNICKGPDKLTGHRVDTRRTQIKEIGTQTCHVEGQAATCWALVPLAGGHAKVPWGPARVPRGKNSKGSELGCLRYILLWLLLDLGQVAYLSEPPREKECGGEENPNHLNLQKTILYT